MDIKNGTIIRATHVNGDENLAQYKNRAIDYIVTRVNKNTYTVNCLTYAGGCKISKEAIGKTYRGVYGTEVTYTVIK